jgi:exodeoxyribonuclease V alpha subunit
MPLEELTGEYLKTVFHGDGNFVIAKLIDDTTIKGDALPGTLALGASYRFFGKWENNPRYGRQFKFDHYIEDEPLTRHGVVAFLMRYGKKYGMTNNRANTLYDAYKGECLRKLREDPDECAALLKSVDMGKLRAFASDLAMSRHSLHVKVELMSLFDGKGFPKTLIEEVIAKWGGRSTSIIKADPFKLLTARFKGAGFARVDTLYLGLGHHPARMKRQVLAAWDQIGKPGFGDTWIPMSLAADAVRKSIGATEAKPGKAIAIGLRSKLLSSQEVNGVKYVSLRSRAINESYLAMKISRMRSHRCLWPTFEQGVMSDHQFQQIKAATTSNVGLLVGTPGTGKTYTVAALLKMLQQQWSSFEIAVCAPTGKAAVRCAEAIGAQGVFVSTSTIHSLLCPGDNGHGTGAWSFKFNELNPLPIRCCIVDETSMVDTDLMASLFRALPLDCCVLLVGDEHQLAPVGHGAPLRDLVAHRMGGVGILDEVRRNAGLIVHGCRAIKNSTRFQTADRFAGDEQNLVVSHASNEAESLQLLRDFYEQVIGQGKRDPFEDVQVLCPMNTKGALSRVSCSALIQSIVNPFGKQDALVAKYRVGDKVICLSNGDYIVAGETGKSRPAAIWLANGEMGRIADIDKKTVVCTFPPTRSDEQPRHIEFIEHTEDADCFTTGYAITGHKSQGSQWPIVVVMADPAANRVCSKEWWYTAISRAAQRCLIIGDKTVVEKQARATNAMRRKTFLRERLAGTLPTD